MEESQVVIVPVFQTISKNITKIISVPSQAAAIMIVTAIIQTLTIHDVFFIYNFFDLS